MDNKKDVVDDVPGSTNTNRIGNPHVDDSYAYVAFKDRYRMCILLILK